MVRRPECRLDVEREAERTDDSARRPWYSKFRLALNACQNVDDIEMLLCRQVSRWRGKAGRQVHGEPRGHVSGGEEETRRDDDVEDLGDFLNRVDV